MSGPNLRKHKRFRSRNMKNERDLIVYLPPGYDERQAKRYPVLYLQDGQNLFDGSTSFIPGMDWHVGQTADEVIRNGQVEPLIIVGVYNTGKQRIREYTPTRAPKLGGGGADCYARFLMEELKPFVETGYRASSDAGTGIGGSSLGGLVSLSIGLKFPHIFRRIAALSPALWWNQRVMHRRVAAARVNPKPKIWLDIGTKEGPQTVRDVEQFRDLLLRKGWEPERDLHYEQIEAAEHNEAAWARRVGPFLRFLYPAAQV